MHVDVLKWTRVAGWERTPDAAVLKKCRWALYFGSPSALADSGVFARLKELVPQAVIMGGSSAGEIVGDEVREETVVVCLVSFSSVRLETFRTSVPVLQNYEAGKKMAASYAAGASLAKELEKPELKHVFLISDGLFVNGDELVRGIFDRLSQSVTVTGGLASCLEGENETPVGIHDAPCKGRVVAVGFYGDKLRIGYGSVGGWDSFGPERVITRSEGNILYELDNQPALDLYKAYLGEHIHKKFGTFHFPLSIYPAGEPDSHSIVRSVMSFNEDSKALVFAGDVPQGYRARLMLGDFDHLVEGAANAAVLARQQVDKKWDVALLVSCIGRKLLLGQRIGDETEAVKEVLGDVPIVGFYSNGEICHHPFTKTCGLHNQTMTITVFAEDE